MSNSRRVVLCRLSFLTLCVVPTLIVAAGIMIPNRRQPWEDCVFRELGFQATIGNVKRPRPGTTVLEQVAVSDPGVGTVARLHAVEVQESSEILELRLVHPEVYTENLDVLYDAIQKRLMQRAMLQRSIEVTCAQLILSSPVAGNGQPLPVAAFNTVHCRIASSTKGCKLDLRFTLPGAEEPEPCQFSFERQTSTNLQESVLWTIDTRSNFVACNTVAALFPPLARLGAGCRFRGTVSGNSCGGVWSGNICGEFANVDMYRLIQEQFPHTFDGLANVHFSSLEIRNNQIVRAAGRLRSQRGAIGNSLIEAAAEQLGCRIERDLTSTSTRYRVIDFSFEVSAEGVRIVGECQSRPSTMIEGQYGEPLLTQPEAHPPLAALARTLVPHSDVQVPLTRQTAKLLSLFPIPDLAQHQQPAVPRATLRLDE